MTLPPKTPQSPSWDAIVRLGDGSTEWRFTGYATAEQAAGALALIRRDLSAEDNWNVVGRTYTVEPHS